MSDRVTDLLLSLGDTAACEAASDLIGWFPLTQSVDKHTKHTCVHHLLRHHHLLLNHVRLRERGLIAGSQFDIDEEFPQVPWWQNDAAVQHADVALIQSDIMICSQTLVEVMYDGGRTCVWVCVASIDADSLVVVLQVDVDILLQFLSIVLQRCLQGVFIIHITPELRLIRLRDDIIAVDVDGSVHQAAGADDESDQ